MGNEHIGQIQLILQILHQVQNLCLNGHVQSRDRLIADHQQDFLRRADKTDYRVTNARSGVDHQYVEVVADVAEGLDQAGVLQQLGSQNAVESAGTIQTPQDMVQVRVADLRSVRWWALLLAIGGLLAWATVDRHCAVDLCHTPAHRRPATRWA